MSKLFKYLDVLLWITLLGMVLRFFMGYYSNQKNIGIAFNEFNIKAYANVEADILTMLPGKTIMLWATWCGPCKIEIKRIEKAIQENEIAKNQLVAVLVNDKQENLEEFVKQNKLSFPLFIDGDGFFEKHIELQGTPTFIQLDMDMKIKKIWTGVNLFLISKIQNVSKD